MKGKSIIIATLFILFCSQLVAQNQYSTIHFLALTTYKPLKDKSVQLFFNNKLAASVRFLEAIHYKIYSEGRISIGPTVVLDVVNGQDYYITYSSNGGNGKLNQVDSLTWWGLKAKCLYDANLEEDITRPWGKLNHSNASGPKSGTCFLISSNGYLITNQHVIDNAKDITITGVDGDFTTKYGVTIIAEDKSNDLALLKINNKNVQFSIPPYALRTTGVSQGERVYAFGYPLTTAMGNEIKLTEGIISAKSGVQGDVSKFQFSAAVQPGNSGGPLLDENGNIIGVIYAKSTIADAANYAIKAVYLRTFLESIDGFQYNVLTNLIEDKTFTDKVSILKGYIFLIESK